MQNEKRYCYHCGRVFPADKMVLVRTKGGPRWRCVESVRGKTLPVKERDAFGKAVAEAQKRKGVSRV